MYILNGTDKDVNSTFHVFFLILFVVL